MLVHIKNYAIDSGTGQKKIYKVIMISYLLMEEEMAQGMVAYSDPYRWAKMQLCDSSEGAIQGTQNKRIIPFQDIPGLFIRGKSWSFPG